MAITAGRSTGTATAASTKPAATDKPPVISPDVLKRFWQADDAQQERNVTFWSGSKAVVAETKPIKDRKAAVKTAIEQERPGWVVTQGPAGLGMHEETGTGEARGSEAG